uniref:Uncharacterized protein n=1 Tax=Arundo donax TaxID=35708 RepID=A0A0A9C9J4_ARUDO
MSSEMKYSMHIDSCENYISHSELNVIIL